MKEKDRSALCKERKKAAIITLAYGNNYGNRLQNFALQDLLGELGIYAETLMHVLGYEQTNWKGCYRLFKDLIKFLLGRKNLWTIRKYRFDRFNQKYIHYSRFTIGFDTMPTEVNEEYQYFISGSDQIWNATDITLRKGMKNFLCAFADPEKRIAYAASFGTDYIPDEAIKNFMKQLPLYKAISVREKTGVKLVEMCGANAVVVLDPTMMRTRTRWMEIARKPYFVHGGNFVVTYFLGGRSEAMDTYIKKIADGKRIIHLENESADNNSIASRDAYIATPDEFLWLIYHASCVLTDSFHGAVFSILFHRPFQVFGRLIDGKNGNMDSRIETLLETFQLSQCRGDIHAPSDFPKEMDWDAVEAILEHERARSLDYLYSALSMK